MAAQLPPLLLFVFGWGVPVTVPVVSMGCRPPGHLGIEGCRVLLRLLPGKVLKVAAAALV